MTRFQRLATLTALAITLAACATVIPPCSATSGPASHELAGTQWELIRWHQAKNEQGAVRLRNISHSDKGMPLSLTISPDGNTAAGFAGCNLYNATITNDEKGLLIGKIAATKKSCSVYSEELERRFLSYLGDYRTLIRDGDRLILMTKDGEVLSFALRTR